MIILDTDHFNILQIGKGPAYDALLARMDASPDQHFSTTVVTFEEHMRGWLAGIRRARDVADQVRPYDQLINLVRFFQAWDILRFDENCAARFYSLRQQGVRIGTLDLKIASVTHWSTTQPCCRQMLEISIRYQACGQKTGCTHEMELAGPRSLGKRGLIDLK